MDDTSKPRGRPFQPGQSGNPSGRPKRDEEIAVIARQHSHKAIDTLVKIMNDKNAPPSSRLTAASALLDRGFGKAPQSLAPKSDSNEAFLAVWQAISDGLGSKLVEARAENLGMQPPKSDAKH